MMKLVLVHGVGNARIPPNVSLPDWIDALVSGGVDRARIMAANPVMAYYGDLLSEGAEKTSSLGLSGIDPKRLAFQAALSWHLAKAHINMARLRAKSALNASNFIEVELAHQQAAEGIGVDLMSFVRDVADEIYDYLTKADLRRRLDARVAASLIDGPMVIIGHSLGSVVAYRLLRARAGSAGLAQTSFVTMGSPLRLILLLGVLDGAFSYPLGLASWLNIYDRNDLVALGLPIPKPNGGAGLMRQARVSNQTVDQHSSEGYLSTPPIASLLQRLL